MVVSKFTYTLETIIQAGKLLVAIDHVPIRTNPKTRESRLFPSMGAYVRRNAVSIFRIYAQYEPLRVFWSLALLIGLAAIGVWIRFAVAYVEGNGKGHVQSLILGAVLFIAAVVLWALGVIGDLLAAQRVMTQQTFERVRRIELQLGVAPSHYEPRPAAERAGRRAPEPERAGDPAARESRAGARRRSAVSGVTVSERRGRHRQHLRQVRLHQPRRAPPDGRLRARPRGAVRAGRPHARCSTSAAARACSCTSGRSASARRASSASTSRRSRSRPAGPSTRRRTSNTASMEAENLPFADGEFDLASAIEVLEHVPDPEHTVAEMARCAERHLLVSVPREPLWRMLNMARGAYWSELGNTPGHLNHWSRALVRRAALAARRGRRGPLAVPLDDVACPPLSSPAARRLDSAPTAAARGSCRSGSPRRAC